jgi:hypothetical protein
MVKNLCYLKKLDHIFGVKRKGNGVFILEEYLEGEKGHVGIYNLCRYLDLFYLTLDNWFNSKTQIF